MLFKKKILLASTSLMLTSIPLAVAISCGESESSAEENARKEVIINSDKLITEKFLAEVNEKEWKGEYNKKLESAWNFWASSKIMSSNDFWIKKRDELIASDIFDSADFDDNKVWFKASDDSKITTSLTKLTNLEGAYPSWTLAQEILKKDPTLDWKLNIENLLLVERYLTSFEESDFAKVYPKEKDEPKNFDKKEKNFFLIKYLRDNKPTIVWEQKNKGDKYFPVLHEEVSTADDFNNLDETSFSLLKSRLVKQGQLKTSNNNGLAIDLGKLYHYKGVSGTGINKGELDYSDSALRKRLKDNTSESGWVTKDGNIESKAKVIVEPKEAKSMFVIQFLPWFDAKDKDGNAITKVVDISKIDDKKSFWRLDSKLKNDSDNMQKLIYTLSMSDKNILSEAKKFMLNIRKYNIKTDIDGLKTKLQNEGVMK